jgi:hypothetical protein
LRRLTCKVGRLFLWKFSHIADFRVTFQQRNEFKILNDLWSPDLRHAR